MELTNKLVLCFLIILLLLCGAPAVEAQTTEVETLAPDFLTAEVVLCSAAGEIYSRSLSTKDEVDVYSLELVADQRLTVDIDTVDMGATLDTILFVYFDSDPTDDKYPELPIAWNDVSSEIPPDINNDPYLEITAEADGRYYLVIYDALNEGTTGEYTLSLKCSDSATPPDPVDPLNVGDLLGSTSSDPASLVVINPADGTSTVRFSSVTGPIADIEYQESTKLLLVAINNNPGAIIAIDPDTGTEGSTVEVNPGAVVALEDAAGALYGVHVLIDEFSGDPEYSLIGVNQSTGELEFLASLGQRPVTALAYHSAEKTMYAAATGVGGAELIKIDLTSFVPTVVGPTGLGQIAALDFSHENLLYGVDVLGTLFSIPDLATGKAVEIGPIDVSTAAMTLAGAKGSAGVSGLTFVVGEPPTTDPTIKTICSSSFDDPVPTDSDSDNNALTRAKIRRNPLHGAIGLFRFEGKGGEVLKFRVYAEGEEAAVTEESSSSSWIQKLWPEKGALKNRVFVVIRDAIPGVHFRVKNKGELPLEFESLQLPENGDGWYYIMVIRPLRRFHEVDYCLSLQSEDPESRAWETLDVAWPAEESEEDTSLMSAEEPSVQVQSDEATDVGSIDSGDTTSSETSQATPVVEPEADSTEDPALMGAPEITEETTVQETEEVTPVVEPEADSTEDPVLMGAPEITEETTLQETEEVTPVVESEADSTEDPGLMGAPPAI